ncbi:MAG: nickel-responsive transcriptional regulator NikR [Polyangiales bacterium]
MARQARYLGRVASELVRFGIAIDGDLLERFDQRVEAKGYANRSEAIRDLIRADLLEQVEDETEVSGALTLVYDHHVRELTETLTEMQHDLGERVVSTLHVHLDHDHCLEVIVMRGPAGVLRRAADRIIATKGVQHGRLTVTGPLVETHDHEREHDHPHPHPKSPRRKR